MAPTGAPVGGQVGVADDDEVAEEEGDGPNLGAPQAQPGLCASSCFRRRCQSGLEVRGLL